MLSKEPLNEQEKRHLRALKLFLEAHPKHAEDGKILDDMTPEQQRCLINFYHLGLDDPQAFLFAHKIMWLAPVLGPFLLFWEFVRELFHRSRSRK